MYLLLKFAVDK